jgi:hypothetical protein
MSGRRFIELEWAYDETQASLHDFIAERINPLLDQGFVLGEVRIETPGRLVVVLATAGTGVEASAPPAM